MLELLAVALCFHLTGWTAEKIVFLLFFAFIVGASVAAVYLDARSLKHSRSEPKLAPERWARSVFLVWTVNLLRYLRRRTEVQARPVTSWEPPPWLLRNRAFGKPGSRMLSLVQQSKALILSLAIVVIALALALKIASSTTFKIDLPDKAAMLFGVASIALILISLLAAFIAVLGWQGMQSTLTKYVDEEVGKHSKRLTAEIDGMVHYIAANIFRTLSLAGREPGSHEPESVERVDLLEVAIYNSREAIEPLEEAGSEQLLDAKNNLAYHLALLGLRSDRALARSLAEEIFERHKKKPDEDYLLTYLRVMMEYPAEVGDLDRVQTYLGELIAKQGGDLRGENSRLVAAYLGILKAASSADGSEQEGPPTPARLAHRIAAFRKKQAAEAATLATRV